MGCCYEPPPQHQRGMLPQKFILPVRIIVLASLAASSLFILRHWHDLAPFHILGLFFHLLIAARALNDCRRSAHYHKILADFERKITSEP